MGTLLSNGPKKVEAIQHRATKLIISLSDSDYSTRLAELRLPFLQHGDIIYSLVDVDVNDLFTLSSGITKGHELKLYKHHSSCLL